LGLLSEAVGWVGCHVLSRLYAGRRPANAAASQGDYLLLGGDDRVPLAGLPRTSLDTIAIQGIATGRYNEHDTRGFG